MTCTRYGCASTHHARGLCGTHYRQAMRDGAPPPKVRVQADPITRALTRLTEGRDGCWVATVGLSGYGYGRILLGDGRSTGMHRLMYEHHIAPVPDGLVLDHLCRNRACCNPWHLDPVTNRINVLRGEGHSALNAAKTHCVWGHPLAGDNLHMDGTRRRCRICHARNARNSRERRGSGGPK